MDVKVEGENVVRNLDMTTHNHACTFANGSVPMVHTASVAMAAIPDNACETDKKRIERNCKKDNSDQCPGSLANTVDQQRTSFKKKKGGPSRTQQAAFKATKDASASKCVKAMRCFLRPYKGTKKKPGCCPGQTPHHIPPKSMMKGKVKNYSVDNALCVCLEGASQHVGSHGKNHAAIDHLANKPGVLDAKGKCSVKKYNEVCAKAVAAQCGCAVKCIEEQLNASFPGQLDKEVKHYQSNSKQLDSNLSKKLDKMHAAPPAAPGGP
jgi:hypothetical protein